MGYRKRCRTSLLPQNKIQREAFHTVKPFHAHTRTTPKNTLYSPLSRYKTTMYGTYMGSSATRAGYEGDLTNASIKNSGAGFGVFGYYSAATAFGTWSSWDPTTPSASDKAPNFMYNEKLTWNDSKTNWEYSPVKYWPNGIDKANETGAPSNTATEADIQYLSFFAYAPYVEASDVPYNTGNTYVGGALPAGVTEAVFTTGSAPTAVTNGIVAMSKNNQQKDMYVKYILNPSDAKHIVDLTWGLRGKGTYQETDNNNNTIATLGEAYNTDLTKQIVGEKVTFLFKHALARVGGNTSTTTSGSGNQVCGLWVVADIDKNSSNSSVGQSDQGTYFNNDFSESKTLITIEEVKIRDAYTYTVTEDTENKIANEESDFLTEGWFDIMNGKWDGTAKEKTHTSLGNGVTYSVSAQKDEAVNDGDNVYTLNADIKEGTVDNATGNDWNGTNSGGATGVTLTKKAVFAADEDVPGLLLIPGTTGGNTLYVTVKYHVRTADPKLSGGFSYVTQEITNKVTLDNSILKSNKYYNLVMHLGMTSVKFEAVVADWSNGNDQYNEQGGETSPGTGTDNTVWLPSNVVAYAPTVSVAANAASTSLALASYPQFGTYSSFTQTGSSVSGVTSDGTNITIALNPNRTNQSVNNTVTLAGTTGKIILSLTQNADNTYTLTPTVIGQAASSTGTITVSGGTISSVTDTTTPSGLTSSVSDKVVTYTASSANETGDVKTYDGIVITISDGTDNYVYTTSITQAAE